MNRNLVRHIIFFITLALLTVAGEVVGQNDPQFVIKKGDHYLAHTGSGTSASLTDTTTFDPATCLWHSGPNIEYNYYFIDDDGNYRYLSAPLALNETLSLSASHPGTVALNNRTQNYYFYDWDHGLARGVQLSLQECEVHQEYNGISDEGDQCWKVVWVSYENEGWQMSSEYGYDPTDYAARYKKVTVTEHDAQVIPDPTTPGGAPTLADFAMSYGDDPYELDGTAASFNYTYTPAYTTYVFDGHTYYFNANGTQLPEAPGASTETSAPSGYAWTLTGEGIAYLSLTTTDDPSKPKITYHTQNTSTSHKTATLTLTVTYELGVTEVRTATVTAKTSCQNPLQDAAPVVTFENVTLSWLPTADKYALVWKEQSEAWTAADTIKNITAHEYTFDMNDLAYGTTYDYRVSAYCDNAYQSVPDNMIRHFTTHDDPGCIVYGAVYGGGRMADVSGDTEVVIVNCDSVLAVFGGNDIAGKVHGLGGSNIVLGVNANDANSTAYNGGAASEKVRVIDVYGGGNGYYMYNGTSLEQAVDSVSVENGVSVKDIQGNVMWHNTLGDTLLAMPSIVKTAVTVTNDVVKLDSVFGGAKNAFVSHVLGENNSGQTIWATYGDSIAINGGTILAVFGGNNFGGSQGYGKHYIKVTHTTTNLNDSIVNTPTTGYGRDFGIRYLYGGGNKVYGSTTDIHIEGGQLDTIFAGGNSASVYAANLEVNCAGPTATSSSGTTFGNIYSEAIGTYYNIDDTHNQTSDSIATNANYEWNGFSGIYNVRTLFGGNNQAMMTCLPNVTLTSGSLGTVYGGGNAGEMMAQTSGGSITFDPSLSFDDYSFDYSTKVVVNSPTVLVDYLYGGCQMSNVGYSSWVQMQDGHVGTLYGGCNISGDVGSTRRDLTQPITNPGGLYQEVYGATYVEAMGGTVYKGVFAGSNGFYHCLNGFGVYTDQITYDPLGRSYVGMNVPTHNETHVVIGGDVVVHGNVYAGGNMAPVGFTPTQVSHFSESSYPQQVGLASVRMIGGEVKCDVYGGGRMASINGSNEVRVTGGSIGTGPNGGALYGGNDRLGKAGGISNRVLPDSYNTASDGYTQLISSDSHEKVNTYVGVTGNPYIKTVYGGGNGAYIYEGPGADMQYCDITDLPIQSNIFVDIAIDGGDGAHGAGFIETVYGGGNGVWTDGFVKVFFNVQDELATDGDHVGTIFGGNNMGNMDTIPDIILLHGKVHTVYGGCNSGAMQGNRSYTGNDGTTYNNIGSLVHLRDKYTVTTSNNTTHTEIPTASVTGTVYGGCRMNGVTNSTLVLVEGGSHPADFFGGSDISGIVSGTSRVVVQNGTSTTPYNNSTVIGNAFGGGNGNYYYVGNKVYQANDHNALIDTIASGTISRPACNATQVDMISGTAANLYGGGNAAGVTTTSTVNMNGGNVTAGIYGGCCSLDTIHGNVTVSVIGGTVGTNATHRADIFGGGYGQHTRTDGNVTVNFGDASHAPALYGDIYGGSALGHVNDTMANGISAHTTTVNVLNGSITGDVYGGGLGEYIDNQHDSIAALVNGKVYVNIGAYTNGTYSGNVTFNTYGGATNDSLGGRVYGANNVFGTPLDSVFVNIYQTAHGLTPQLNHYPTTVPSGGWNVTTLAANASLPQAYAIQAVYGGGNLAAYTPNLSATDGRRSATVHVYQCKENTVRDVFGGGNAADVGTADKFADTYVIVDGGRLHRVIGGGNGEKLSLPAANIYGAANTTVYSGLIDEVYGGANMQGSVDAINLVVSHPEASQSATCADQVYGKVFGCANAAPYNRSVTTTIKCGVGEIGELYGGSNQASIGTQGQNNADVTLNLYGGNHTQVFAGSKGIADDPSTPEDESVEANIYGNVTLNLYGGTVEDAFGGSDANGNIAGTITVNVLDHEGTCGLDLTNVYGGSNLTPYAPTSTTGQLHSPIVNVMHINNVENGVQKGIRGNVYGGGNQAAVTGNPVVNIGYDAATMAGLIPATFPTTISTDDFLAYVSGNVFGGGNLAPVYGTDTVNIRKANSYVNNVFGGGNQAGTTNTVVNVIDGTVANDVYGGCNTSGTVTGDIKVNLMGGTVGNDVFGGGMGSSTATQGNILVTVDGGTVTRDVYGGSALGQVNNTSSLTKTWLKSGTVGCNLYGGGMGQLGEATYGQVNGSVEVLVAGGTVTGSVFGCNNTNGQPISTVKVTIDEADGSTIAIGGNVFGGGNEAYYDGTPLVEIKNGTVANNVFGGGNNITTANKGVGGSNVLMTGGTVLDAIYGGCNTDGDVTGNSVVTITGGTIGATGLGNSGAIFGGGYGHLTEVKGNVTVTFGDLNAPQSLSPILYGDLYGGSALGNVNTDASNKTTVNIYNGEITGPDVSHIHPEENTYGNVYGGGLGDASHPALVRGEIYVNIGATASPPSGMLSGKATLINCNVFGCNNVKGSPQDNVYVNVYQTAHIQGTNTVDDNEFAIFQVFGGGNRANYAPENGNENSEKKVHVYIHACENTVRYVYGGGNAADAVGVVTLVGGGHFDEIFGGGNGAFGAANIGKGGIGLNVMGGRVSYLYAGSNKHGICEGPNYEAVPLPGFIDCGELIVESFFFGDNEAEHYGDIVHTILCDDADNYHYTRLYAGSRWAIVYGDIKLTVCGGFIQSLFGGSMGYAINQIPAHVRMFPSWQEIRDDLLLAPANRKYSADLVEYMNYDADHPENYKTNLVGKGGNIELIITGGTIGEAIGGCDELGNVEGKITVIIDDAEHPRCPLRIGNIYGASDYTYYEPCDYEYEEGNTVYYNPAGTHGNAAVPTPQVEIIHVDTTGVAYDFNRNGTTGAAETFAGNIYGGANRGDIISNPRVTIGDGTTGTSATKVTIGGDVYGGGNIGHVKGSPNVVVVPNTNTLTFNNTQTGGTFTVSYPRGTGVSSGAAIGEGISLRLEATPTPPTSITGYVFDHWEVSGTGASVNNRTSASTLFTMGSADASVSATFAEKPAHTLTIQGFDGTNVGSYGSFTVDGTTYNDPVYVVQTASVTVHVTPAAGYAFDHWEVSGTGATLSSTQSATTVFTMGTAIATLTAHFKTAYLLKLQANNDAYGLFRINGDTTNTIYLASNDVATVVALPTPADTNGNGYLYDTLEVISGGTGATLSSTTSPSFTFTMGTEATTLKATFTQVEAHELTMQAVVGDTTDIGGSFKVNGTNYTAPVWIAQGASVPIVATPANGYKFKRWIDTNAHGTIGDINAAYTVFIMGAGNTHTIQAEFEAIATHTFNFAVNPTTPSIGGTITVTDSDGNTVESGTQIREYATLTIVASPHTGFMFTGWTIDETGANAGAIIVDATRFMMGTADVTLTANFVPARYLTLSVDGTGTGSFTVNEVPYTEPVLLPVGSTVTIGATPGSGSTFSGWTVVYPDGLGIGNDGTFILPAEDTEIKGTFNQR